MQRNNIRFILLILCLSTLQIIINNSTKLYIDCLSVVLVIMLFSSAFSLGIVVLLALLADLIGHWYLGSHLFAVLILSFLTTPLVNFYRISSYLQMNVTICIFYAILTGIIALIGLSTHNLFISWYDFTIDTFILCPLVLALFNLLGIKSSSSDIIY
ncbi:MAG: hypothetical protein KBD37_08485 [Burkholderiales bacterium]|nr:hypothetical protein [Burkholderiales bacterium]